MKTIRFFFLVLFCLSSSSLFAVQRIQNVCRIKGQERTVIHGFGIVTGLNGTGDNPKEYNVLSRAIIQWLEVSGQPMQGFISQTTSIRPIEPTKEVASTRNAALVAVTVTIPETGGMSGDLLDVTVTSINKASTLEHGYLAVAALMAPIPQDPAQARTLGIAWGKITLDNDKAKNVGTVKQGCRLTADYMNPYVKNDVVTLVISKNHASPQIAPAVAEAINNSAIVLGVTGQSALSREEPIAKAMNQQVVTVRLPKEYLKDPMAFIGTIMNEPVSPKPDFEPVPRIVINERAGIITGGERADIDPVIVSHAGISILIENPPQPPPQRFVALDTPGLREETAMPNPRLQALTTALNAVKVPTKDMIAIIKTLDRQGAIQADIIYE